MVKYVLIDGELVSVQWFTVLRDMRKAGVWFNVNEGHRTIARQQYFWGCGPNGCCCCNSCNLAAFPSPFAPHIRTGRIDHAIDFGNDTAVYAWLRHAGLNPVRTVSGESWHIEVSAANLQAYHAKHGDTGDKYDTLPKHIEHAVRVFINRRKNVRDKLHDRNSIDSKREPDKWLAADKKLKRAIRYRARSRRKLEGYLRRADKANTRKILRQVLDR